MQETYLRIFTPPLNPDPHIREELHLPQKGLGTWTEDGRTGSNVIACLRDLCRPVSYTIVFNLISDTSRERC